MTRVKKSLLFVASAMLVFAVSVRPAAALTIYTLNDPNDAISGFPAPFGQVSVNLLDPNTATITFTAFSNATYQYLFGDGQSVGVNVNGAYNAPYNISFTQPPSWPHAPDMTLTSDENADGFGKFNLEFDNFDGFGYAFTGMTFTIDKTSGTWANEASVLTANALGNLVEAHIFIANAGTLTNTNATGYATNTVPDGGMTISLLGLALSGVGLVARRRR